MTPEQKTAQMFLDNKNYIAYYDLVSQGYIPTPNQEDIFDKNVFSNKLNIPDINHFISQGFELKEEHALKILINADFLKEYGSQEYFSSKQSLSTNNPLAPYQFLAQSLQQHISSPQFTQKLYNAFKNCLYIVDEEQPKFMTRVFSITENHHLTIHPNDKLREHYNPASIGIMVKLMPDILLKTVSKEDLVEFIQSWQHKNERLDLEGTYGTHATKSHLGYALDHFYSQKNLEKNLYQVVPVTNLLTNSYPEEKLSIIDDEMWKKIKHLDHLTQKNHFHSAYINMDQLKEIKEIMELKTPQVIKKYLDIPDKFRFSLKNTKGQNSQEITLEALSDFENKLQHILSHLEHQHKRHQHFVSVHSKMKIH